MASTASKHHELPTVAVVCTALAAAAAQDCSRRLRRTTRRVRRHHAVKTDAGRASSDGAVVVIISGRAAASFVGMVVVNLSVAMVLVLGFQLSIAEAPPAPRMLLPVLASSHRRACVDRAYRAPATSPAPGGVTWAFARFWP